MPVLSAENLGLSFGEFDLFKGISVSIPNDAKIGFIGPNGIGKTSILLILAGIKQPTSGQIHVARGKKIGYLRQEAVEAFADRKNTVYDEMLAIFEHLRIQQQRLTEMETALAKGDFNDELLSRYGEAQHAFEQAGGYEYETQIKLTLEGLGIGKNHWYVPLNQLSGGQQTRALLARLLLEKPALLMLDEPTNHLDIEVLEWLENKLREWVGAVLTVSHDRYFLDNTVNTIWEMNHSGIDIYTGNYSAYLLQRQERWEYRERVFVEEKERLLKQVDFIQRNWVRESTHARALGVLRRLSRELAIVETYGVLALRNGKKWHETGLHVERPLDVIEAVRKVNAIQSPGRRPLVLRPRLAAEHTSGTLVLRSDHLVIGYPARRLFTASRLELKRGECAALIGANGSGKTTFLKVLLGQIPPLEGEFLPGAGLKIGYFAQAHDTLHEDNTVLDELLLHKEMDVEAARNLLARYLFRGEDVFKQIKMLSGGERARLALAILSLDGANFLLLDEPTNHLDIPAREALQGVLEQYTGTILLVSHDRFLINSLATQIWDIQKERLVVFKGKYNEYLLRKATTTSASVLSRQKIILSPRPMTRDNSKKTRQRTEEMDKIERRIRETESTIQRLSSLLERAGAGQKFDQVHQMSLQLSQEQARLETLVEEWEKLAS